MFNTLAGKFGGFAGGSVEPGTILVGGVQHSLRSSNYSLLSSNNIITLTNLGEPFVAKIYVVGGGGRGGDGGRYDQGPNGGPVASAIPSYFSAPTISTLTANGGAGGASGSGSPPGSGGGGSSGGPGTGGAVTNPGAGAVVSLAGNAGSGGGPGSAGPSGTSGGGHGGDAATRIPPGSPIYPGNYGFGNGGSPGASEPSGGGGGAGGGGGGAYLEHQLTITPGVTYSMRAGDRFPAPAPGGGSVGGNITIEFVS